MEICLCSVSSGVIVGTSTIIVLLVAIALLSNWEYLSRQEN